MAALRTKALEAAIEAAIEGAARYSSLFDEGVRQRIPRRTGALAGSLVYRRNRGQRYASMSEALSDLGPGDSLQAASTSEYWQAVDLGLHLGGDGRSKGSKSAPRGMSGPAALTAKAKFQGR